MQVQRNGILTLTLLLLGCTSSAEGIAQPIDQALNRATPLSFGMHVSPNPEENPIKPPERFSGYHVGLDFEISTEELEKEVPVYAICTGTVVYSGFAEGYGGLLVQRCRIGRDDVTVLYGHLSSASLPEESQEMHSSENIGILADARSHDSGENRKHLHLGIHRGKTLDMRGYVQSENEITEFIDPRSVLPQFGLNEIIPDSQPYWEDKDME